VGGGGAEGEGKDGAAHGRGGEKGEGGRGQGGEVEGVWVEDGRGKRRIGQLTD
jgi:hypothetical protein